MFLTNYKRLMLAANIIGINSTNTFLKKIKLRQIDGKEFYVTGNAETHLCITHTTAPRLNAQYNPGSSDSPGIVIGTGTTPPTEDDYHMESPIPYDDVTVTNDSVLAFHGTSCVYLLAQYTLTNNTDADISVSEVGIMCRPDGKYYDERNTSTYYWRCLVERTVLERPVVVSAGGQNSLCYLIRLDGAAV